MRVGEPGGLLKGQQIAPPLQHCGQRHGHHRSRGGQVCPVLSGSQAAGTLHTGVVYCAAWRASWETLEAWLCVPWGCC